MKPGEKIFSPIFGDVEITEVFETEAEARAAGYCFDALAHDHQWIWKVLAGHAEDGKPRYCGCCVKAKENPRISGDLNRECGAS